MGGGSFNYTASATRAAIREETKTSAFVYSERAERGEVSKLHSSLDLTKKPRRECREVPGKAPATPILIALDVTGSMREIPAFLIKELNRAMKLIVEGNVVTDPQICFAAFGDATCDQVPVMVGEFEADDAKAEEHLSNIFLEGGGGGGNCESYELIMWFAANQVDMDCVTHGEKGFLFMVGDEAPYKVVDKAFTERYLGVTINESVTLASLAEQLQQKFEVFVVRPAGSAKYNIPEIRRVWESILPPQNILNAQKNADIVPLIAGTISIVAGQSLEDTIAAMEESGFDSHAILASSTELTRLSDSVTPTASGLIPALVGSSDAPVATRL